MVETVAIDDLRLADLTVNLWRKGHSAVVIKRGFGN